MSSSAVDGAEFTFNVRCGSSVYATKVSSAKWLKKPLRAALVQPFLESFNKAAPTGTAKIRVADVARVEMNGEPVDMSAPVSVLVASAGTPVGDSVEVNIIIEELGLTLLSRRSTSSSTSSAVPDSAHTFKVHCRAEGSNDLMQPGGQTTLKRKQLSHSLREELIIPFLRFFAKSKGVAITSIRVLAVEVGGQALDVSELSQPATAYAVGQDVVDVTICISGQMRTLDKEGAPRAPSPSATLT
eukprot:2272187-Prymnesium_polylepis.4